MTNIFKMKRIVVGAMVMMGWLSGYSQTAAGLQVGKAIGMVSKAVAKPELATAADSLARTVTGKNLAAAADSLARTVTGKNLTAAADSLVRTATGKKLAAAADSLARTAKGKSLAAAADSLARTATSKKLAAAADSIFNMTADSVFTTAADSAMNMLLDSTGQGFQLAADRSAKPKRDWTQWRPDPKRALWLALVIPGGGQIYNRKYWKLPLVYGGFVGCFYAMTWNNMMYKDYSQAYLDIMDNDPGTASYNSFMHLGQSINDSNMERYKDLFKKRKDRYRRYRDMSFFVLVGIYALSVIDAYVDAELSVFDISKDLSLKVEPAVINTGKASNMLHASSVGLNCSLNF